MSPPTPPLADKLETGRSAHIGAVALAMVFPTAAAGVYFVAFQGHPVMKFVYGFSKVPQLLLPLVWVLLAQRRKLAWSWPTGRGVGLGLLAGVLAAAAALAVYHGLLKGSPLASQAPDLVKTRVEEMGLGSPGRYLSFAVFLSFPHALLEEYYWRWFVFGQLRRVASLRTSLVLSSLAFMSHHVIIVNAFVGEPLWLIVVFSLAVAAAGFFFAWLYERSGSLLAPWLAHVLADLGIMLIGYDIAFG